MRISEGSGSPAVVFIDEMESVDVEKEDDEDEDVDVPEDLVELVPSSISSSSISSSQN